ncbi:MAG: hypothetical protein ACOH1Y_17530 [Propionicimonas sp.]
MCKPSAEGGRCATHTRQQLTKAHTHFVETVLESHTAEVAMSNRTDALATEMGLSDFTQLPDHAYDTDPELSRLGALMRDADEDQRVAKRSLDMAFVEHALTRTGRKEVEAQALAAKGDGRPESAAYLISKLHQADDLKAALARYAARRELAAV